MRTLDITEEEFMIDEANLTDDAVLQETWPVFQEKLVREFEEYLMDIGVRIWQQTLSLPVCSVATKQCYGRAGIPFHLYADRFLW